MATLPACRSISVDLPAGKEASLLQRGFLQVFSYRETLTEQICTMQVHSHERMLQKFLSSTSHSSVGLIYRSHSLLWYPLHCLHSSCPQATHMAFFPPQTESEQISQPTSAQKFVPRHWWSTEHGRPLSKRNRHAATTTHAFFFSTMHL